MPQAARLAKPFLLPILIFLTSVTVVGQSLSLDRELAQDMLAEVTKEIEKNFYAPGLRGVNLKKLTADARQRIDRATTRGEMLTAIFTVVDQLQDSHTRFYPPPRVEQFTFGFEAKAFGDEIRVYKLKKGGAAETAGLQIGDRLLAINGMAAERDSFDRLMVLLRAVIPVEVMQFTLSRGKEFPLTILVQGKVKQYSSLMNFSRSFSIIPQVIREAETARAEEKVPNASSFGDGVGYLSVRSFMASADHLYKLVKDIKKYRTIIIDLRDNHGGTLDSVTYLTGFFEEKPIVIASMVGRKESKPIEVKPRKPALPVSLFVLVDSETSSGAEIFTRHFQRTGRAVVIGDRTPGRVTAGRLFPKRAGVGIVVPYGVNVAIARAVFPDGEELEGRGVTPDHPCIPTANELREKVDPCLSKAVELARAALSNHQN